VRRELDYRAGNIIAGWTLDHALGTGGNAEVWRATSESGQSVALKILRRKNSQSEPYQRFRSDIAILRELNDIRGIIPLWDACLPERPTHLIPAWIVMALATPIREAIGAEPELETVVSAISRIAETLALLAARQIHHRDIKPENLYHYESDWCLGDFGLVDYPAKDEITAPGKHVGPIYYLAPELLTDADANGEMADVYSLAKTFWVLATDQRYPLPGSLDPNHPHARLGSFINHDRVRSLELLLASATELDPKNRPSMEEVAQELKAWITNAAPTESARFSLGDIGRRLGTVFQRRIDFEAVQRERRAYVNSLCNRIQEQLIELAVAAEPIIRLEARRQTARLFFEHPEIAIFRSIAGAINGEAGFFFQSPSLTGEPWDIYRLFTGVSVTASPDDNLCAVAGYALSCRDGVAGVRMLWVKSEVARLESSLEQQRVNQLISEMAQQWPAAIEAFAAAVDKGL
jgi:hypothetical protein